MRKTTIEVILCESCDWEFPELTVYTVSKNDAVGDLLGRVTSPVGHYCRRCGSRVVFSLANAKNVFTVGCRPVLREEVEVKHA